MEESQVNELVEEQEEKTNGISETGSNSSFEDLNTVEEPKDDEWLDILGSGSLLKKIIKKGVADNKPHRSDICKIKLKGMLEDGTEFENYEELEVQVGDMEVIQGIDLALTLMELNEEALLKVAPRLAFGEQGEPPKIPQNATLIYQIELLSIDFDEPLEELPISKRKIIGNKKRERGNYWYSRNECNYALQLYRRALDYLDEAEGGITMPNNDSDTQQPTDMELQELLEDRMKVYNNMAAAQMKIEAYNAALKSLNTVLMCQPKNIKALFRKARVHVAKKELKDAIEILKKALAIEPLNQAIVTELDNLKLAAMKQQADEKLLAQRMFKQTNDKKDKDKKVNRSIFKSPFIWAPILGLVSVGLALLVKFEFFEHK